MKQKWKNFIISFLIYGLIYGLLMYLIGSVNSLEHFFFSVCFFGFFMAVFNTFILPSINKNKTDKQ